MSQNTTRQPFGMTGGMTGMQGMSDYDDDENDEFQNQRKIKPFSFDIDDDIDTEVLTNEQVYDDLKELDDILDES